ncbi:MAG: ribose 5-phosphate isomerase B [Chloroflexi bacterium]|nr:ribose 5-phosphate isomerase B [Chloroflexota bacterium]MBU1660906.1 ribose 5-phosphate isomerase B [Chloroflexota bacterium]
MRIAIACDHAGFPLKKTIIETVKLARHKPIDLGTHSTESVDYADYAEKLGHAIQNGEAERGILLCGSGVGASIAANKMKGVYAAICHDTYSAHQGVEHDAMNVLCLGGRIIGPAVAKELVTAFLNARFLGNDPGEERHARRVGKVRAIEQNS